MAGKLNARQARFCQEYIVDLCATQAATRAGYSERTAYSQAHDLLRKPEIAARIAELQAGREARTRISADQTIADLRELADIALGRKAYIDSVLTEGEVIHVERRKFQPAAAVKALELLGRHQGLFNDKVSVQHSGLDEFLRSLAQSATSTPAGRIRARLNGGPYH